MAVLSISNFFEDAPPDGVTLQEQQGRFLFTIPNHHPEERFKYVLALFFYSLMAVIATYIFLCLETPTPFLTAIMGAFLLSSYGLGVVLLTYLISSTRLLVDSKNDQLLLSTGWWWLRIRQDMALSNIIYLTVADNDVVAINKRQLLFKQEQQLVLTLRDKAAARVIFGRYWSPPRRAYIKAALQQLLPDLQVPESSTESLEPPPDFSQHLVE